MGTQQVGLRDVSHGAPQSRARLLAPLRYLFISHQEKTIYDFLIPSIVTVLVWGGYMLMNPKPPLFGDDGLLRFVRDLLIMAVPFMVGSLAAVAMGSPGDHMDKRVVGSELYLDGNRLTLRQFVCYLLGYLSFLGLVTLGAAVFAALMCHPVLEWTKDTLGARAAIHAFGVFILSGLLSFLTVQVFWSLYFLTDVINRK